MYLMIVRRGCEETFELLRETFRPRGTVQIVWDRRGGERRSTAASRVPDRRQSDRRRGTPHTWETLDFVVVPGNGASGVAGERA